MFQERHNADEVIPMSDQGKSPGKVAKFIDRQCYMKHNIILTLFGAAIIIIITWTLLYLILYKEVLPSGDLFRIIVLVLAAYIVGILFSLVRLPALLGMLITGVVLKTVGFYHVSGVYPNLVVISRNVALSVILARAGLGLDAAALKRLKFTVIKLSIIPCCGEAVGGAIFSHFIIGFPWLWAFLLGFLLSAVSPAVVVPTLLSLKEQGYGEDKGIGTLVLAASSIDDICSISVFGIFFSALFSKDEGLTMAIIRGPLEIVLGLLIGILWGLICAFIPHKNDPYVVSKRTAMVGIGSLVAVLGSIQIDFSGAGPLACITGAFVAALCWKIQGWSDGKPSPVSKAFNGFWIVMQPILFSLIGTEIDLYALIPENVGFGILIVILSLIVRITSCFLAVIGDKLNLREVIFVNFCWLPKATVQAALCAQALDHLRKEGNACEDDLNRAMMLITTAIIAVIITAPIGAIAIAISGPKLLNKVHKPKDIYLT
ncbi:hypothetical protein O3M35_005349 [Rhynocoris fuscipes]